MNVDVSLTVNGTPEVVTVDARSTLADMLRDRLGLTATHLGCEQGVCGSCTVLVDGLSARSCLMLAASAGGRHITTLEGLLVAIPALYFYSIFRNRVDEFTGEAALKAEELVAVFKQGSRERQ